MSVRTELVASLTLALDAVGSPLVVPISPALPDQVTRPTLLVAPVSLRRLPAAPHTFEHTLDLLVLTQYADPVKAEADLEASLDALLPVLFELDQMIVWDTADRVVVADTVNAYKITARAVGGDTTP